MSRSIAASCALLLLVPTIVVADPLVVPLDLGEGDYEISPNQRFEQAFTLATEPIEIQGASLRLVGVPDCQYLWCWPAASYEVLPYESAIRFGFIVDGAVRYATEQVFACEEAGIEIDLGFGFATAEAADWSFLAEGQGTLFIEHCAPDYSCPMGGPPSAWGVDILLTRAELRFEPASELPVEPTTWDALKAWYRGD